MADNARGIHVSPGIYTREIDMTYAVRSLGITTLGLVGETQRGPAFQATDISNWREFQEIFGGTNTEKFKGSQYPKYELPYIAKSYLSESEQLKVVRVLGLCGFNAGPAWLVTASNGKESGKKQAVAVIRSRGHYNLYTNNTTDGSCQCEKTKYDTLEYEVGERNDSTTPSSACTSNAYNMNALHIRKYIPFQSTGNECSGYTTSGEDGSFDISQTNRGRFKLVGVKGKHSVNEVDRIIASGSSHPDYFEYAVSLNPLDKDYILKVLGTNAYDGDAPIFVESLYDVALEQGIVDNSLTTIDDKLVVFNAYKTADYCQHTPVDGIVERPQNSLNRKFVGKRYLADKSAVDARISCAAYDYKTGNKSELLVGEYWRNQSDRNDYSAINNPMPIEDYFIYEYDGFLNELKYESDLQTLKSKFSPTVNSNDGLYNFKECHFDDKYVSSVTVNAIIDDLTLEETESASSFTLVVKYGNNASANINYINPSNVIANYINGNVDSGVSSYTYSFNADNTVLKEASLCGNTWPVSVTAKTLYSGDRVSGTKIPNAVISCRLDPEYSGISFTYTSKHYGWGDERDFRNVELRGDRMLNKHINATDSGCTRLYRTFSNWLNQPMDSAMAAGQIYTVKQYTTQDGKRQYYYAYYDGDSVAEAISGRSDVDATNIYGNLKDGGYTTDNKNKEIGSTLVLNNADGLYYKMVDGNVKWVELDMNDYKSAYRYASTPWIVSNLKGDYNNIEVNKLFRFHTITDGNNANYEVKVSIENIRPDDGVFDVVVRRVDDLDESIVPLEKFTRCSMIPSDSNYIAYKIGSFDGVYESKSKFITVEVNETSAAKASVPAGFLGYPIPMYSGITIADDDTPYAASGITTERSGVTFPTISYNRDFDEDVKNRKQYFGLSSWVGVDIDTFTFKGNKTYINDPRYLSHGFHLDSRLDKNGRTGDNYQITVDGELDYEFDSVSINARTSVLDKQPIIGKEEEMYGSIYENVNLRKFTVFFYGGFDGWDDYRDQRTNTDEFKMSQYRGYINQNSGEGYSFDKISNPDMLQLNQNGITSDWYAYLSGIRQFANPEATDINVFATPGIDYVNQKLLVQEAIEMIEEERADSIYVVTTPDKPSGAGDYVDEMYSPEDVVYNLEDTEIDSNYSCTYYPWVKYFDQDNSQYIYLPATKDVVRNFAQTDNQSYPWFAPAGVERGQVDCVRAHYITKLADEDTLYEGRINPIKTFAQDGPKIWGQKNLQINESQLNRIAVRRLLLRMRKLIAISCIGLIFEPNDATVKQSFISTVTPILDSIRSNRGISDYRIEVNDTVESRERRELPAKIYFKPYNALEYITIDFILTPEGVSFDDI